MKLSHKLIAGYVVIAVITAVTGLIGINTSAKLKRSYEDLALGGVPIHKALNQLKFAGLRIVSSTSEAVAYIDAPAMEEKADDSDLIEELKLIDSGKNLFYKAIGEYASVARAYDRDGMQHVKNIEEQASRLLEASFNLIVAHKTNEPSSVINQVKGEFEKAEIAYLGYLDNIIANKEELLEKRLSTNINYYSRAFTLFIILGSFSLLVAFTFGILQAKNIADNLATLARKAERIGQGDLDQPVEVSSNDELAELAKSFNIMAADLKKTAAEREKARQGLEHYAERLENNARELQQIVFVASHDLQEPLRKIMTFCEIVASQHQKGVYDNTPESLNRMSAMAAKMRSMLDDLLHYSKLINIETAFQPVDFKQLMEEVADTLRESTGIEDFEYDIGVMPVIEGDQRLLKALFFNLADNSLKFRNPERRLSIEIKAEKIDDRYRIIFADNGQGFKQKYAERIFDIFEKVHSGDEYPGTGIGLALCRKIVEKHGGNISATSQEETGTKVVITLPAG